MYYITYCDISTICFFNKEAKAYPASKTGALRTGIRFLFFEEASQPF